MSISFDPLDGEPLDPRKPRGGQRFVDWELLELSAVSVPSDVGAVVTARAHDENGDETMADIDTASAPPARAQRDTSTPPARHRAHRASAVTFQRGLYDVAELCYLFERLGWATDQAAFEAAIEGDQSKVPGMLLAVLADLGDALLAMTAEELAEALAKHGASEDGEEDGTDDDCIDVVLTIEERQHIAEAGSPQVRAYRRGLAHAKLRAGKSLSAETVRCLRDARDLHDEAMAMHRSAMRKHKDGVAAIDDLLDRAGASDAVTDTAQTGQTAGDTSADDGSQAERAPDMATFRQRQVDLLALTPSD